MESAILTFLKGKKTYAIAAAVLILGALQGLDLFTMPNELWPIIGACGLASLRAGVDKTAKAVREATKE